MRILENLEVVEVAGKKVYRCATCGYEIGPVTKNYREKALKNEAPISKNQPIEMVPKKAGFILREYYCPQCAILFEVEMAAKGEKETVSILLK